MKNDLERLQGSWQVASLTADGQKMDTSMLAGAGVVVAGERFSSTGMGLVYEGTIELDEKAKPRELTMKFDAGPEKGNTNLGIYELKGDTWKLCLATRGTIRPKKFAAPAGTGCALETLKRGKAVLAAKTKPAAAGKAKPGNGSGSSATEIEGEWKLVSAVMDGKPMEESLVQWVKRVTQGNQTTVYAGPQVMLKAQFTVDLSKSPKAIEYLNLTGSDKGKNQQGIYELEGGVLKFCISPPGAKAPAKFESKKGDKRTLTIWKLA